MVNLYDSPAQAQFINTYVPIQFEGLYKVAEKAQADMDKGQELLDKLNSIKSLGSLSKKDNADYEAKYTKPITEYINNNVKSNYDLTNPEVLSKLASLTRMAQSDPDAVNMLETKAALKDAAKKVDAKWGSVYGDIFSNYSSVANGVYSGNPMAFRGWEGAADDYTSELSERRIGKNKNGEFIIGIPEEDIYSVVNAKKESIAQDPEVRLLTQKAMKEGQITTQSNPELFELDPATKTPKLKAGWEDIYGVEMVAKAKIDKSKGRKYEFDDASFKREQQAKTDIYRNRMLDFKKKEQENAAIIETYMKDKTEEAFRQKRNLIGSKLQLILSRIPDKNARWNKAVEITGSAGAATYAIADAKKSELNKELEAINIRIAAGQANKNVNKNDIIAARNIQSSIREQEDLLATNENSFATTVRNEEQKALDGKSQIGFNRASMQAFNTFAVPAEITDEWLRITLGKTSKPVEIDGVISNAYAGKTSELTIKGLGSEIDDRRALGGNKDGYSSADYGNILLKIKPSDRPRANRALSKFNRNLRSGYFDGKGVILGGSDVQISGDNSRQNVTYYVPVENLTQEERITLTALYGTQNMSTRDKSGDSSTGFKYEKKAYVPVPMTIPFAGETNKVTTMVTDAAITKKMKDVPSQNQMDDEIYGTNLSEDDNTSSGSSSSEYKYTRIPQRSY